LGIEGSSLTGKFILPLGNPVPANALGGALYLGRDGYKCLSVPRRWCSGDRDNRGHHIAPSGVGESRAPPFTQGSVALIGKFLWGGVQGWWPTVHHPYKDGA
jgi:hypothetical protein